MPKVSEWVCDTPTDTLKRILLFIFVNGSVFVCSFSLSLLLSFSLNRTDVILTSIPCAIRNPIMSIGFIVAHISVHLCSDMEFVIYSDDLPLQCAVIHMVYLQYCIKCNVNREQRILSTAASTLSRNVIIILSFGFQVARIWTCSAFVRVCIQPFNMIISINWYCGCVYTLTHGLWLVYYDAVSMRKLIKIQKLILRIDKIYMDLWASTELRSEQSSKIYAEILLSTYTHTHKHFIIITSQSYRMLIYSYCFQRDCVCVCARALVCIWVSIKYSVVMIEWYVMWYGGVCDIWHNMSHFLRYASGWSELIIESDLKSKYVHIKCGHNLVQPICCSTPTKTQKRNLVRNILHCHYRIVFQIWHDPNSHRNILV